MFCTKCGNELRDGDAFCSKCGQKVSSTSSCSAKRHTDERSFKCPFCGALLPSFAITCPECGHELRDGSSQEIRELVSKIEALRNEEAFINDGTNIFKQVFTNDSHEERIEALVRSFQIPKTKEGFLEFITLASANIDSDLPNSRISRAWRAKLEEAESRAHFIQGDDQAKAEALEVCQQKRRDVEKADRRNGRQLIACFILMGALMLISLVFALLEKMV